MTRPRTELERRIAHEQSFWRWFWFDGARTFLDRWLILHVAVGFALNAAIPHTLADIAKSALLPVAAILIGLAFAWSGSALALLQTSQIQRLGQENDGLVFRRIVLQFQAAILVILSVTVVWSLAAAGIGDAWTWAHGPFVRTVARASLLALSSLAFRECWQVTLAVQRQLIIHMQVYRAGNPSPKAQQDEGRSSTRIPGEPAKAPAPAAYQAPRVAVEPQPQDQRAEAEITVGRRSGT
jgi:hypothetical protein